MNFNTFKRKAIMKVIKEEYYKNQQRSQNTTFTSAFKEWKIKVEMKSKRNQHHMK